MDFRAQIQRDVQSGGWIFLFHSRLYVGAVFVDAGNIWNVLDNVEDERSRFTSIKDFREIAVSSGLGLRYDLSFFVIRFDVGFKTYNPAYNRQEWFQHYNFAHAVYNVGINYPF